MGEKKENRFGLHFLPPIFCLIFSRIFRAPRHPPAPKFSAIATALSIAFDLFTVS